MLNAFFVAIRAEDMQCPDVHSRYNLNGWPTIVFCPPKEATAQLRIIFPRAVRRHSGLSCAHGIPGEERRKTAGRQAHQEPRREAKNRQVGSDLMSGAAVGQVANLAHESCRPCSWGVTIYYWKQHLCFPLRRRKIHRTGSRLSHSGSNERRSGSRPRRVFPHDRPRTGVSRIARNCSQNKPVCWPTVFAHLGSRNGGMAEGIIEYLALYTFRSHGTNFLRLRGFFGTESTEPAAREEFFTIIDRCIYTDANALAAAAYLDAAAILGKTGRQERALRALEFLWDHCRSRKSGMCHYFMARLTSMEC